MYQINHIYKEKTNLDFVEILNPNKKVYSKIHLNQGGSLQELTINGFELIKKMSPLTYNATYASAILFPFANRIKDGAYKFNNETYQFDINEKGLNNALHGLVYNKTFKIINSETNDDFASVVLAYQENNKIAGFPYTYTIQLEYILTQSTLSLKVEIKNTDSETFPFTLGWHPYFLSSDLYKSLFIFDSNKKIKLDNRNITESIEANENVGSFEIKSQTMDDCYILNTNKVEFQTPKYNLSINSSEEDSFLQLYTPPHKNTIAIEPTTGVSDSFNNGIGLKTLKPQESYHVEWNLEIKNK
jgi:aldose 1-epimerase